MAYFTCDIDATASFVYHCEQSDDRHSFRLGTIDSPVYLTGTFDELMTFAHIVSTSVERARYQRELIALEK